MDARNHCILLDSHHSEDLTEVWHGEATPLIACGFHVESLGITRLARVKREPVTVERYLSSEGAECYSIRCGERTSILVTPAPRGRTGWEVWHSDSLSTLHTTSTPEQGIRTACARMRAARAK